MKRRDVAAFVDWQSQLINAGTIGGRLPSRVAQDTAVFVTDVIQQALGRVETGVAYFVTMKVYHGWHRGLTATENYKALKQVVDGRLAPSRKGSVSFNWQQPFGHTLLNCSHHRLHPKIGIHLPNTIREDREHGGDREKMVDTALTCDLLTSARSNPEDIRLILAEDDDLIPGAFTADFWGKEKGGRTLIIRRRNPSGFLNMTGIYQKLEDGRAN